MYNLGGWSGHLWNKDWEVSMYREFLDMQVPVISYDNSSWFPAFHLLQDPFSSFSLSTLGFFALEYKLSPSNFSLIIENVYMQIYVQKKNICYVCMLQLAVTHDRIHFPDSLPIT